MPTIFEAFCSQEWEPAGEASRRPYQTGEGAPGGLRRCINYYQNEDATFPAISLGLRKIMKKLMDAYTDSQQFSPPPDLFPPEDPFSDPESEPPSHPPAHEPSPHADDDRLAHRGYASQLTDIRTEQPDPVNATALIEKSLLEPSVAATSVAPPLPPEMPHDFLPPLPELHDLQLPPLPDPQRLPLSFLSQFQKLPLPALPDFQMFQLPSLPDFQKVPIKQPMISMPGLRWRKVVPIGMVLTLTGALLVGIFLHSGRGASDVAVKRPIPDAPGIGTQSITLPVTVDGKEQRTRLTIGLNDGRYPSFGNALSDGEGCIAQQNARVKNPSMTVIAVTTLSQIGKVQSSSASSYLGSEDLHGLCLRQKLYNDQPLSRGLRLMVANIGTKDPDVLKETVWRVTKRIINAARRDQSIIGVVGYPFSQSVAGAMEDLNAAHIPVISPSATSVMLSSRWKYFFRVVPPDERQGSAAIDFALHTGQVKSAIVLRDPEQSYSNSLGVATTAALTQHTVNLLADDFYTTGDINSFGKGIVDIQQYHPDLVFCACYADDADSLLGQLRQIPHLLDHVMFMGGEGLYELGGYTPNTYHNIFFTGFAYPDTISILCSRSGFTCDSDQKEFYAQYCRLFDPSSYDHDPQGLASCNRYLTSRPGQNSILSYDGLSAFIEAYAQAQDAGKKLPTRQHIQNALAQLSFQGISGQINFSNEHSSTPLDKAVLILCVDQQQHTHLVATYGQFLQGGPATMQDLSPIRSCQ